MSNDHMADMVSDRTRTCRHCWFFVLKWSLTHVRLERIEKSSGLYTALSPRWPSSSLSTSSPVVANHPKPHIESIFIHLCIWLHQAHGLHQSGSSWVLEWCCLLAYRSFVCYVGPFFTQDAWWPTTVPLSTTVHHHSWTLAGVGFVARFSWLPLVGKGP